MLKPEQIANVDAWLRSVLWDSKLPSPGSGEEVFEVHRLKARLPLSNGEVKIVQGVREVFEIVDAPNLGSSAGESVVASQCKVVVIGRNLVGKPFEESFIRSIAS